MALGVRSSLKLPAHLEDLDALTRKIKGSTLLTQAGQHIYKKGTLSDPQGFVCVSSMAQVPSDSTQRVGLTCSSCTSLDSAWCHTKETIECTGDERRCIFKATTISGPKYSRSAVRGCATKTLCDTGSQSQDFGNGIKVNTDVTCTSDSTDLQLNLLLLTMVSLLLANLMHCT
ncbi:Hypothetical predicted protein [Pelobates cultripes]|uniref:UPAR/Ly6 domain-containing protein n=1 Tax=Pelobates cultripes TaxID=61616 RepID=A0AAD1WMC8_PELCU|nr:Hypothetical predicted protein [Pelobates cultripes]